MKKYFSLLFVLVVSSAYPASDILSPVSVILSARRREGVDYTEYESRARSRSRLELANGIKRRRTPLGTSRLYRPEDIPALTRWRSLEVLQERFERVRDEKFLRWNGRPDFFRRSSWFYPDDGCFARAALANRNLFRWFYPVPNKIFVFGNLRVKTKNSPRGSVGWWYHVAPIVEVESEKYVLDPSIEYSQPLLLQEWLERMGNPAKMKVAICKSGTYSPSSDCTEETQGMELRAERAQQYYLDLEWKRMQLLGRMEEL